MGMFTTIKYQDFSWQIHIGNDQCEVYNFGDEIPWAPNPLYPGEGLDGVYYGDDDRGIESLRCDAWIVIHDHKVAFVGFVKIYIKNDLEKIWPAKLPAKSLWTAKQWARKYERERKAKKDQIRWRRECEGKGKLESLRMAVGRYMRSKLKERGLARRMFGLPEPKFKKLIKKLPWQDSSTYITVSATQVTWWNKGIMSDMMSDMVSEFIREKRRDLYTERLFKPVQQLPDSILIEPVNPPAEQILESTGYFKLVEQDILKGLMIPKELLGGDACK